MYSGCEMHRVYTQFRTRLLAADMGRWKYDFRNFHSAKYTYVFPHLIFRQLHLFDIPHSAKYTNYRARLYTYSTVTQARAAYLHRRRRTHTDTHSTAVRHLGIYLDYDVSMRSQVTRIVSQCFAILRQLRSIHCSLSHSVFQSLVAALVLTKLDFGNVTLAGIPSFQVDRLQAVMNAAARLVFQYSQHDHITPLLYRLHWLRAPERTAYKLAVLVYQCVHGLAPAYLADALQPVVGLPGRQRLRSSSTSAMVVLQTPAGST